MQSGTDTAAEVEGSSNVYGTLRQALNLSICSFGAWCSILFKVSARQESKEMGITRIEWHRVPVFASMIRAPNDTSLFQI